MATIREVVEGLKILAKYAHKGLEESIGGAGHDIIWGPGGEEVNEAHRAELEALGWFWDDETEGWAHYA